MTLDPNTHITVTLNAAQWNLVLGQLSEGPYKLVAPILNTIQQQCMMHDAEAALSLPPLHNPANGAGDPHPDP